METTLEKDLGSLFSKDLEWNYHVNSAISKVNRKLGMI